MARWRPSGRPPAEPPAWYRVFCPARWDVPDEHEAEMIADCTGGPRCWPGSPDSVWPGWPQWLHEEHAERRWAQARHEYRRRNPDLAAQEFAALMARRRQA